MLWKLSVGALISVIEVPTLAKAPIKADDELTRATALTSSQFLTSPMEEDLLAWTMKPGWPQALRRCVGQSRHRMRLRR